MWKTICSNRANLKRHLKDIHKLSVKTKKLSFVCPVCHVDHPSRADFDLHLRNLHDVQTKEEERKFRSYEGKYSENVHIIVQIIIQDNPCLSDFIEWKIMIGHETNSFFAKEAGRKRTMEGFREFFRCNRSGKYDSKATRRHERIQGTRKIGGFCPSSIKIFSNEEGETSVKYCPVHLGHQDELKHLNVPKEKRLKIAAQLRLGIPKDEVLRKLRQSIFSTDLSLSLIHI